MSHPTTSSPPLLRVERVQIDFAGQPVVQRIINGLSFSLAQGEIGCLLGASGCGKTTLLRAIAGFQTIQRGQIQIGEAVVASADHNLAPEKRRVGLVFQEYALFPHLTIAENVGFGLRLWTKADRQARVNTMLSLVGLAPHQNKYPHELSGGQQQRVALARALAPKPDLLLLDEPFSNLDVALRERLSVEVRNILKEANATAILVTHDQLEAFAVADSIGVMHEGRIVQWDNPYNLYHQPNSRFVADFVGQGVFVNGLLQDGPQGRHVHLEIGALNIDNSVAAETQLGNNQTGTQQAVDVLLRPDDIQHDDASPLQAEVVRKVFRGADFLYTLRLASGDLVLANVPSHHDHAIGEKIGIRLDADHVVTFPKLGQPT